jgi:iron uptake system component EfeO
MKTAVLAAGAAVALALTGCTANTATSPTGSSAPRISVNASDDACQLDAVSAPAGTVTFVVANTGTKINEFYLLAADGKQVVAEVEDIGPGVTRQLVLDATVGNYFTVCKPGMSGDGIRAAFEVRAA